LLTVSITFFCSCLMVFYCY